MYTIVIGFLITYFVGWLLSRVYTYFIDNKGRVDEDDINPELFFPPIAKALRKNKTDNLLSNGKPRENGDFSFTTKF